MDEIVVECSHELINSGPKTTPVNWTLLWFTKNFLGFQMSTKEALTAVIESGLALHLLHLPSVWLFRCLESHGYRILAFQTNIDAFSRKSRMYFQALTFLSFEVLNISTKHYCPPNW